MALAVKLFGHLVSPHSEAPRSLNPAIITYEVLLIVAKTSVGFQQVTSH